MGKVQLDSLLIFTVGLIVSFAITPFFVRLCHRRGIVDKPGPRRVNTRPVARMGGPAMYLGFMACLAVASLWIDHVFALAAAGTIVFLAGVADDVRGLKPAPKLLAEIIAAIIIFFYWNRIEYISNPFGSGVLFFPEYRLTVAGHLYVLKWFAFIVTVFWIVGITNTLNLIDGLDGLAAGITCIASVTFFLVSLQKAQPGSAILSAALVGVTAGFLRWNFYPAKTFMGDSGALFLGFIMSAIAVNGAFKVATALSFLLPVLALGVPIFDTAFAIVRRLGKGQPVMSAPDKGHIHHRLLAAGWLHRDAVILIYIATLVLSIIALVAIHAWLLALYLVAAIAMLVGLLILLGKLKKGKRNATKA